MKKNVIIATVLFLTAACNSNKDKEATPPDQKEPAKTDSLVSSNSAYPLSGKFELIDYKKDNVKVDLPKTIVEFTSKGEYIKPDGNSFFYKIEGDSISILLDKNYIITKSGIEFPNSDKSTFIMKNSKEKTEYTYQKIK